MLSAFHSELRSRRLAAFHSDSYGGYGPTVNTSLAVSGLASPPLAACVRLLTRLSSLRRDDLGIKGARVRPPPANWVS